MNRAFFGKTTCLKIQYNNGTIYFHMGKKDGESWSWDKVKMGEEECGEIVRVINGKQDKAAFFHQFGDNSNKIWVSKKDDAVFVKINEVSKGLTGGEQEVLRVILERLIFDSASYAKTI